MKEIESQTFIVFIQKMKVIFCLFLLVYISLVFHLITFSFPFSFPFDFSSIQIFNLRK